MRAILFENARVFDGVSDDCPDGMSVLVEGGVIREVSATPIAAGGAVRIDLTGRTLMPGLIDLHIHAYLSGLNVQKVLQAGDAYRTAHAVRMLGHALDCGFTTVRDVGGGDWSLSCAIADGLIRAPRFFYSGKVLSMTGGHGDYRHQGEGGHDHCLCSCGTFGAIVADGLDACVKAAREELRRGAHCIKIMGSGGIASPTDPIWMNQYREDEIRAIVAECTARRTYAASHCHPAEAIRRSVDFGVRCIEHGTLIDAETARFVAERGAFVVPTTVTIFVLKELGPRLGLPPASQDKAEVAFRSALAGLDVMRSAGVKLGFGTDLLGETYVEQCREFLLRRDVFTTTEILRQATSVGATILQQDGLLGCVAEGAHADLIVVDGDPTKDIGLLAENGRRLSVIMRGGELVKNVLDTSG